MCGLGLAFLNFGRGCGFASAVKHNWRRWRKTSALRRTLAKDLGATAYAGERPRRYGVRWRKTSALRCSTAKDLGTTVFAGTGERHCIGLPKGVPHMHRISGSRADMSASDVYFDEGLMPWQPADRQRSTLPSGTPSPWLDSGIHAAPSFNSEGASADVTDAADLHQAYVSSQPRHVDATYS